MTEAPTSGIPIPTQSAPIFFKHPYKSTSPNLIIHTELSCYLRPSCALTIHTTLPLSSGPIRNQRNATNQPRPYNPASRAANKGPSTEQGTARKASPSEDPPDQKKIMKPQGEAGRPGRAGYTLTQAVASKWDEIMFAKIQVGAQAQVRVRLGCVTIVTNYTPVICQGNCKDQIRSHKIIY